MSRFDSFKDLPDDFKITVGDKGEMTLGELRGLETAVTERDTQLQATAAERDGYRGKYDEVTASMAKLVGTADQQVAQDLNRPDPKDQFLDGLRQLVTKEDPSQALFEDKLFGKALSTVEERAYKRARADLEPLIGELKQLSELTQQGFTQLTQAQVNQRESTWYGDNRSDIPKIKGADGKERRMSLSEIKDYATQRNITLPNSRLLDLDRTLDTMLEPQRVEQRMTEAERRGYEKGLEAMRANQGREIPLFGDRSGGAVGADEYSTAGKSARQILSERIAAGLQDVTREQGN